MAQRWLIASGDTETAAIWDGGTLPAVGDDLYANGFVGTITISRNAASWRNTAGTTAVAGGNFACSTAGVTIGGDVRAGSTWALVISHTTGTIIVNGSPYGSTTTSSSPGIVKTAGAGTLTVTGTPTGGSVSAGNGITVAAGTLNVTGSPIGGSAGTQAGISVSGSCTVNVTGDPTGGTGAAAYGVYVTSGSPTISITGTPTGGTSTGHGLYIAAGTPTVTVNGSPVGGTGSGTACGVYNTTGTVTITGNPTGGTSSSAAAYGAYNATTGTMSVNGYAIGAPSGGTSPGLRGELGATTTVSSIRVSAAGVAGAGGKVCLSNLTTGTLQGINAALTVKTFYPTDYAGLLPAVADVESGVIYNLGTWTGTFASPSAGSVLTTAQWGAGGTEFTGTYVATSTSDVRYGTSFGALSAESGTCHIPTASQTLLGVSVDATEGNVVQPLIAQVVAGVAFGPSSSLTGVFAFSAVRPSISLTRSAGNTKPITFSWPVTGATITAEVSIDNSSYVAVQGAIAFLRTEGTTHLYTLAYDADDRPTGEGVARYKFVDANSNDLYVNLRVEAAALDSGAQTQLDKMEAVIAGTVTGAGTSTEVFVGPSATVTITVDANGNRSDVVVS